jgi:hypothetical protein
MTALPPGLIPPSDLEAERVVLASLLIDTTDLTLTQIKKNNLADSDFFDPKHQLIFRAASEIISQRLIPDEVTVTAALRENLQLDQAGGVLYITELTSALFSPSTNVPKLVSILKDKQKHRLLITTCRDIQSRAQSGAFTPEELAQKLQATLKVVSGSALDNGTTQKMELDDLWSFDRENDPNNLIGRRWICRGGSLLFSAQAGAGKSTLLTQMAISWALGKDLWGIKPVRPLRILIVQSENDAGDLGEQMIDVCNSLHLSGDDRLALKEQMVIYREAVKTGEAFGELLEDLVVAHRADLCFCDPLLGFAGGDVSKQEFCSHFLRHILQPILMRTGVALIAIHHQNKPPKKKEDQAGMTSTYDFTGSSELANWFRSTAILRREDPELPHFTFKLGKRGTRAGMRGLDNQFTESLRIRHSKVRGEIKWEINNAPPLDEDV